MRSRRRRDVWDVVVVGGGITGLTAAWQAARRGLATALLECAPAHGGQVATVNRLDDWPAVAETSGVELAASLAAQLRDEGVAMHDEPVAGIAPDGALVRIVADGRELRTRRALIASGASLKALDVPGETALRGKGVSQCAHCDGPFFRDRDVVVVGGGDAALQEALVLAPSCRSVTIVARSKLRAKAAYVERAAGAANVRFVWDSTVGAVLGKDGVTGVVLHNVKSGATSEIECSGVFPFIGTTPNTAFVPPDIARDAAGCLVTDGELRTAVPAVYAAGAVRSGYGGQLTHAVGEAAAAVQAMARDLKL